MSLFQNAYGNFLSSALPYYQSMPGIITPYGTLLKPGGRIAAYVRSTGAQDGEDHFATSGMLVSTLQAGLARCRSGQGDIVYVLPGHVENIASADVMTNLVAGTQIISAGKPGATNNPTFTWTGTAGTFLLDVADVTLMGLNFNVAGADNVVAAMTVSAAGCSIINCDFLCGTSSVLECALPLVLSSGATDCLVVSNRFYSSGGAVCTSGVQVNAATRPRIIGNEFDLETASATVGALDFTGAVVQGRAIGNILMNRRAGAAVLITIADTANSIGVAAYNLGGTTAAVATLTSMVLVAGTSNQQWRKFENRISDSNATSASSGAVSPALVTLD